MWTEIFLILRMLSIGSVYWIAHNITSSL
jgi:hypothetical protein